MIAQRNPTSLKEEFPRLLQIEGRNRGYVRSMERDRAAAREFANKHMRPRALEIDRRMGEEPEYFDWDIVRAGLPYRLLSFAIPEPAGGTSTGHMASSAVAMEELCAACPGIALIFGAHALGVSPLLIAGMAHWDGCLAEITAAEKRGEPILMACALTEPSAGTDVEDPDLIGKAVLNSHARKVKGGYRLSGTKCFISNGSVARWITVVMPVDPKRPADTWSCFLVDAHSEGFSVGHIERKMGQRASHAAEIIFDDVFVPDELLIGRIGDGLPVTMIILATSRPVIGAISTGIARGAYERLLEWAETGGSERAQSQYFQLALAEIETEIHLARQVYMDAITEIDINALGPVINHPMVRAAGFLPKRIRKSEIWRRWNNSQRSRTAAAKLMRSSTSEEAITRALGLSSMAKVVGSNVAMSVTNRALELVGLEGGPVREEIEKLWRDAKLTQIYEGTNQLNMLEVYRALCAQETIYTLPRV